MCWDCVCSPGSPLSLFSAIMSESSPVIVEPAFESGASTSHSNLLMERASLAGLPSLAETEAAAAKLGYTLRRLQSPADREGVCAVLAGAFGDSHGAWDVSRVDRDLLLEPSVKASFVAVESATGTVVAVASARVLPARFPGAGYLHWVGVHPAHQSRGLGLLVSLAVLHEFAGPMALRRAVLETQDERGAAIACYLKLQFVPQMVDAGQPARWEAINKQASEFKASNKQA